MSKNIIFVVVFALFLLWQNDSFAFQNADAFIVHAKFDQYTILSPTSYHKMMSMIIHNDTLVKIYGRLENETKTQVKYFSISSQTSKSVEIKANRGEKVFFYPLSPPFQKIVLNIGRRYYEIPEKKQSQ